jgi:glycosyltransferase involved in cell wall biosynthesis
MIARPRLLFFQNGDYADAFARFQGGEVETYGGQQFSVGFVEGLCARFDVTLVTIIDARRNVDLAPGLRTVGITAQDAADPAILRPIFDAAAPDLAVCRSPVRPAIDLLTRRGIPLLPIFADSFYNDGIKALSRNLRLRRLRRLLTRPGIPCVADHSLSATRSLARALLLPKTRVAPWDWAPLEPACPRDGPGPGPFRVIYAGTLSEAKGLGDALAAVAILARDGHDLQFEIAGGGDLAPWRDRAAGLGVAERVVFLGPIANADLRARMRAAGAVLVPSRHSYSEGLPKTLLEGLAAGTPVVASDHPAFAERVRDGQTCLLFRGGDPAAMARRLAELMGDPALFAALSAASAEALASFYIGERWHRMIELFLDDPRDLGGWVAPRSLHAVEARLAAGAP